MDSSNAVNGRIVRIKLHNFLTYDDCELFPGDHLNVILGPNGTGKSSIVCAICLGLGGSVNLLGRAKDIGDYIKHRAMRATIEIELYRHEQENLIVQRVITKDGEGGRRGDKSGAVSHWFLNGKHSNQTQVIATAAKLNVQMSNLCQFLPQDRVCEFAKMNPQDLLKATELAVGEPGMYLNHESLIALRDNFQKTQGSKHEKEVAKERVEQQNQQLERDVERYLEREKYQEKIDMLNKKKLWVEYEAAREEFMHVKKDKVDIEARLKNSQKENAPLQKELDECKKRIKETEDKDKQMREDGSKLTRSIKHIQDRMDKEGEKIEEISQEMQTLKKDEEKRVSRISKLKDAIQSLQREFEKAPDPELLKPQSDELSAKIRDLSKQVNTLTAESREYLNENNQNRNKIQTYKAKISELESTDNQKLESLRRFDKTCYDVVMWLRENQHQFSGTIYEPIMTQINMKNIKDAVFLESTISFNDFRAFVSENRQDQKKFGDLTKQLLNLEVASVCPPENASDSFEPRVPLNDIKKFGFKNYLTDLFDCPKTVLQYLCENYNLHNVPVGNQQIEKNINRVINELEGFPLFFTPKTRCRVSKSKYSGQKSTNCSDIKENPSYLSKSVDLEQKRQLTALLKEHEHKLREFTESYTQAKSEATRLEHEVEAARKRKADTQGAMKQRHTIQTQIDSKQNRLTNEEQSCPDVEGSIEKAKEKIKKLNKASVEYCRQLLELNKTCVEMGKSRLLLAMKMACFRHKHELVEEKTRQLSDSLKSLEDAQDMINLRFTTLKQRAKDLLKAAQKTTGGDGQGGLIPDTLKAVFDTLPNTLEEIEALIHEEQAKLDCQCETNPQVIKDYEKNRKEVQSLEKEILELSTELQQIQEEIDSLLKSWLVPLEKLVSRIDEQYRDFFKRMGCAGQVSLEKDPDEDYRKFGIQIQVKFRAENKLKNLTATFQSGGERSVSTMLYLISLQELTKCPFRLVDEINQGMDPNNERRVFELMVETVCRPQTSQYFLITPKLLPDLCYTEKMTILTVFNGHWMLPHNQMNLSQFIAKKKRLKRIS